MKHCNNCNLNFEDADRFCPECGSQLVDIPETNQASQVPPVFAEAPVQPVTPVTPVTPGAPEKPKKKIKGKQILAIVLAIVIAFGGIVALIFPSIEKMVLGEADYYLLQEYKLCKELLDIDALTTLASPNTFSAASEIKLKEAADLSKEDLAKLSANVAFDFDKSKNQFKSDYEVNFDSEKAKFGIDYADKKIKVRDETSKHSFVIDTENINSFINEVTEYFSGDSSSVKTSDGKTFQVKDYEKLAKSLAKIVKKVIDKDQTEKGKADFDGKTYKTVTFTLMPKDAKEFLKEVKDEMKTDEVLYSFVESVIGNPEVLKAGGYDDVYALLDEIIDDEDLEEDYKVKYVVYYGSRGTVVNRELYDDDRDLIFSLSSVKDKKNSMHCRLETGEQDDYGIILELDKSLNGKKVNLDVKVNEKHYNGSKIASEKFLSLSLNDIETVKINKVNVLLGSVYFENYDEEVSVKVDFTQDSNNYLVNVIAKEDDETLFNAEITTQLSNAADTSNVDVTSGESFEKFAESFFSTVEDMEDSLYDTVYDDSYWYY